MLYHGQGGEQDLAEARHYLQQAADLGDREAMNSYAFMLDNGQGGEPYHVERCFRKAVDRGDALAVRALARKQGASERSR